MTTISQKEAREKISANIINKVISGNTDTKVFDTICILYEYTNGYMQEYCFRSYAQFRNFDKHDCSIICQKINHELSKYLKERSPLTFIETVRIMIALSELFKLEDFKTKDYRKRFCKEFFYTTDLSRSDMLKTISLLDKAES